MFGHIEMIAIVVVLLGLVFSGVHIAIALGITAALGIYLMPGDIEVVRASSPTRPTRRCATTSSPSSRCSC